MPDTTVLPTGGMSGGNGGTNWLLVGGVGVGVVVLLLMVTKSGKSAGQPTTAAGTSINAALGSIQEQNLNLMGQLGQEQAQLGGQIGDVGGQVTRSEANLAGVIDTGNRGVINTVNTGNTAAQKAGQAWYDGLLASLLNVGKQVSGVSGQVSGVSGQISDVGGQVSGVSSQVGAQTAKLGNVASEINASNASLNSTLNNMTLWDYMINARLGPGGAGNPQNWPGGAVPSWFSGR